MRRRRSDGRAVNGGRERMDQRLLGWCRRAWQRMSASDRTAAFLLMFFVLLLVWVAFGDKIGCGGRWIYDSLGVIGKTEAINKLGLAIAGVVAFWGVVAANRRADAIEAANCQRAFKDGVEHLGSDKSSVRQGGAHALFHLALEDDGLRASIAGVLCAHIQETTGKRSYQEQYKDKPSTEMQSLLKLLFTTETVDEGRLARFWRGAMPDLEGGYFCGVELKNARFRRAKLSLAQFKGAKLTGARFQEAQLDRAQFQRAWLSRARFQGAWMRGTRFYVADLRQTQFQGADLALAQFQGARLSGSQFQGASLCMAGLQQATLGEEHGSIPAQGHTAAGFDDLVKQLKTSAFHGVSSRFPDVHESFEQRIKDRIDKQSDFFGVIFSGGVTEELLAEVKQALDISLEWASWSFEDPAFDEGLIPRLTSEIDKPVSNEPPAGVLMEGEGSYDKKEADEWIREFHKVMDTAPKTNQAA